MDHKPGVLGHDRLARRRIQEALQGRGCPACALGAQAEERFLEGLLHEGVNDPGLRLRLRASQGFCRRHAQDVLRRHGRLGPAILFRDLLERWLEAVGRAEAAIEVSEAPLKLRRSDKSSGRSLARSLERQADCPACEEGRGAASRAIAALLRHLTHPSMRRAWSDSSGLCLPHFRQALKQPVPKEQVAMLVERQRQVLQELVGQLSEIIRKHDHRFQHEPFTEQERDAWARAVATLTSSLEL